MKHRYKVILLLPFLFVLFNSCNNGDPERARRVLEQTGEHYRNLTQFRLQATVTSVITAGVERREQSYPVRYAASLPGKLRIEVEHETMGVVLVSDGSMTWTYLPRMNQYTVEESSPLQTGINNPAAMMPGQSGNFVAMGEQLVREYRRMTENLKSARVIGEEKIGQGQQVRNAVIVEAEYADERQMKSAEYAPVRYWIDQEHYMVLKKEETVNMINPNTGQNIRVEQKMTLHDFTLDPDFPDKLFSWTPPDSAEAVTSFDFPEQQTEQEPLVGQTARDFTLQSLAGDQVSLKQFEGKVVLLDFWATWCGPCLKAHPHLESLHKKLKDRGLVVLGISSESRSTIANYINEHEYTFTNLIDSTQSVTMKYRVGQIPSVFIINRDGKISSHLEGYNPQKEIRKAIEQAGL